MRLTIEVRHPELPEVRAKIAPLKEEMGEVKKSSLPTCIKLQFDAEEVVAEKVLLALGPDMWEFDGNTFKRKS